jgi:8-oxo-dGTP diphosphatase
MSDNYSSFHVGVNVIVVRDRKLLLGKRKNVYGANTWGLPGGHLEHGEKLIDAAARELLEETGLRANELKFENVINNPQDERPHYFQIAFLALGVEGEPELKEPECCYGWEWFDLNELPEEILTNHVQQIELFRTKGGCYGETIS